MDWVVVRNRTGHVEARNMARIEQALTELSKRVGFACPQGLSERVIYRELFPSGLTLLDKGHLGRAWHKPPCRPPGIAPAIGAIAQPAGISCAANPR